MVDRDPPPKVNKSRAFVCKVMPCAFVQFSGGTKRMCKRCGEEEWLMTNRFPKVGEPQSSWQSMNFNKLKF